MLLNIDIYIEENYDYVNYYKIITCIIVECLFENYVFKDILFH